LLLSAARQAQAARLIGEQVGRSRALLLAVDQAEELFAPEYASESKRFLSLLSCLMPAPAGDFELFLLLAIRADSVDRLLRALCTIGIDGPETFALLPLPSTSYRDVILKPIEVLARQGQRLTIEPALADRLVNDAIGADALPLLAFTLSRLHHAYASSGSHEEGSVRSLTHRHYVAMGGVGGSIDNALGEALVKSGIVGTQTNLRRLIIPHLATWDREADAAKRSLFAKRLSLGTTARDLSRLSWRWWNPAC
jgi:hypothetical protein